MSRGHYLKAAERACTRKARYETPQEAERTCDYRFRAYRCPVCGAYHLTSQSGPAKPSAPEPLRPEPYGPKMGDLDWSQALDPQPKPKPERPPKLRLRPTNPPAPPEPESLSARCTGPVGKDGRVLLALDGRLVKSARVRDAALRKRLATGVWVRVRPDTNPPEVLAIGEAI